MSYIARKAISSNCTAAAAYWLGKALEIDHPQADAGAWQEARAVLSKAAAFGVTAYAYARPVAPNGSSYSTFLDTLVEFECFKVTDNSDFDGGELAAARLAAYGSATLTGDELYQRVSGALVCVLGAPTSTTTEPMAYLTP